MERKNGRNEKTNGGDDKTEERYEMETQNIQNEITSALEAPKTKNRTAKNLPCGGDASSDKPEIRSETTHKMHRS